MATRKANDTRPDTPRDRRGPVQAADDGGRTPNTPNPIEMAMELEGGALARDVLTRQARLIEAQTREVHFNHVWHLVLRAIGAALAGFVLIGLIAMLWEAAHDESLVIDAFTAPPEFVERGLSGEVIAAKVQDELNALDRETATIRSPRSYANAWEGDIRVEVPEAKVSLGELRKSLHEWLGDATHISGSAYLEGGQARLEARVNGKSFTATGTKDAIDPLVSQLALAVFKETQPYRFAVKLLFNGGRDEEAFAILDSVARSKRVEDRYWSHSTRASFHPDIIAARVHALQAVAERADGQWGWMKVSEIELTMGHQQASADALARTGSLIASGRDSDLSDPGVERLSDDYTVERGLLFGDMKGTRQALARAAVNPVSIQLIRWSKAPEDVGVLLHDRSDVDTKGFVAMANTPSTNTLLRLGAAIHFLAAQQLGDWEAITAQADAIRTIPTRRGTLMPLLAEAYAHTGKAAEADAIIAAMPVDHYERWRTCGRIAAFRQDWAAGERCFREAIRQAPSIPRAYLDYGMMLMAKGDLAGAAREFALANEKGPKWADPLKAWGDLLLRQGKQDEARRKYAAALKFAPAWAELRAALRQLGK